MVKYTHKTIPHSAEIQINLDSKCHKCANTGDDQ